jgi:hypothetical protein
MGLLSWLFPSEADRLQKARDLMAQGRYEDARRGLVHCTAPEAEALYDACSAAVDEADAKVLEQRARAAGFRGWKVEVSMKDGRTRARLEALITRELARAGIDLGTAALDQAKVDEALARVQKKAQQQGMAGAGTIKLVPITSR